MQFIHRLILILLFSNKIFAQEDPSTWPAPSGELIKGGFYSKERLKKYFEWKKGTLPDLFLLYNPNEIKYSELKWGEGNFQHRFTTVNFPLEFVIDNQPSKKRFAEIKSLSINAVDTINLTEPAILIKSLNETWTRREDICFKLRNQYRDFYIAWTDKPKEIFRLFKITYCRCEFEDDGQ
jgi:hypothetical protein